jgi:hypothetical protein
MRVGLGIGIVGGGRSLSSRVASLLRSEGNWWDMAAVTDPSTQVLPNLGTVGAATNLQRGSTGSVDSNDPTLNLYAGRKYVALPGAVGNYLGVAEPTARTVNTSIRATFTFAGRSQPAPLACPVSWGSSNVASPTFAIATNTSTGGLRVFAGPLNQIDTVGSGGVIADSDNHFRVTLNNSPAGGNANVVFETSADPIDTPYASIAWVTRGTHTHTAALGSWSIPGGNAFRLGVASWVADTYPAGGKMYRTKVEIDGATTFDFDAASIPSAGSTSFTCSTGQTVTIASAATGAKTQVVTASMAQLAVDDYFLGGVHSSWTIPTSQSVTMWAVYRQKATPTSQFVSIVTGGALMALALISDNTTVSCILRDDAGVSASRSVTRPALGSLVVHFLVVDRVAQTITQWVNGTPSAPVTCASVGEVSGTLYFPYPGWDGEVRACGLPRRVLTPAEIADITAYYQGVCV